MVPTSPKTDPYETAGMTTTPTIHVNRLRKRVEFVIITIREDEFEAVLNRLTSRCPVVKGRQGYEYAMLRRPDGRRVSVAVVRAFDQGQTVAQLVARDAIEDLAPRWLILTGIAGGIPDNEFSLGDVLLAPRLHDFSVTAAIEDQQPQFRPTGGPSHPAVERLLAYIPAYRERLGRWNEPDVLACQKPSVAAPDDLRSTCYYGTDKSREAVRASLQRHFPIDATTRSPLFKIGTAATANILLKDTTLLAEWRKAARDITHIEMEAGGVYAAARHARPHEVPLLCVRGISDIVGFSRTPDWTPFACHSAASFVYALLLYLPLEFYELDHSRHRPSLADMISVVSERLRWFVNVCYEGGKSLYHHLIDSVVHSRDVTPTLEAISSAFVKSSTPLLARVVAPADRIDRTELQILAGFPKTADRNVLCVLGSPGSGKTAVLALAAKRLPNN
jgi:nucleoside phosphorylase